MNDFPLVLSALLGDQQSALDPAGPQAASIRGLFAFMVVTATIVYLVVLGALVGSIRRGARSDGPSGDREATAHRRIRLGVGATVIVAFVLLIVDFSVGRGLMQGEPRSVLSIKLTGRQWWWDAEYEDSVAQNRIRVANELHIPVGRPVLIKLVAHDVIHSFWVPNLGGKKDLIPGHRNEIWIRADRPGVFRGQCAEFCGVEHAKMGILVVAEPPDRYAAWAARQRAPALAPTDSLAAQGRAVLESRACALCHTVAGTLARGRVGPDLTHVAGRLTLAAVALTNTPGNLAGWIVDPQAQKPGAQMPATPLSPTDLRALLAYLRTLE